MSYQRDRTDAYSEFCYDSPNHIMDVRDASDNVIEKDAATYADNND